MILRFWWLVRSIRGQSPDRQADQRTVPAIDDRLPWDDVGIVPYGESCKRCISFRYDCRGDHWSPAQKHCVYIEGSGENAGIWDGRPVPYEKSATGAIVVADAHIRPAG